MEERVRISRTIVNQVMASKEAILSADAASDTRFETSQSIADLRIRSVMCVPLIDSEGQPLGAIQIDTLDQRHRFQQDDLDVLASVASQAAIAVDNAQMHENALKQQSASQRDLELAHKVQRGLLPSQPPRWPSNYHFFDFYESANQVGGDYYDYIELPGHRAGRGAGRRVGQRRLGGPADGQAVGRGPFCLASEPDRRPRPMKRINAAFAAAAGTTASSRSSWLVVDPRQARSHRSSMPATCRRSCVTATGKSNRSAATIPACRWVSTADYDL